MYVCVSFVILVAAMSVVIQLYRYCVRQVFRVFFSCVLRQFVVYFFIPLVTSFVRSWCLPFGLQVGIYLFSHVFMDACLSSWPSFWFMDVVRTFFLTVFSSPVRDFCSSLFLQVFMSVVLFMSVVIQFVREFVRSSVSYVVMQVCVQLFRFFFFMSIISLFIEFVMSLFSSLFIQFVRYVSMSCFRYFISCVGLYCF